MCAYEESPLERVIQPEAVVPLCGSLLYELSLKAWVFNWQMEGDEERNYGPAIN